MPEQRAMAGPLAGVRVVEVAEGVCGPYAAMQLADSGCEVIKVEPLAGDVSRGIGPLAVEGQSALFLALNRNKRSLAMDLDHPAGQEIARKLACSADVLLDCSGAGVASRRGLDYATLAAENPGLIYASVSPFGEDGPLKDRPGAEFVVQALAEVTSSLGVLDGPPIRLGADVAGINTAIMTNQAIIAALFQRRRTGKGQAVSTSMLGTLLHLRGILWTAQRDPDDWYGVNLDSYARPPDYGYRTKDIPVQFSLGRGNTNDWYELLLRLNMLDVIVDPRFDDFGREAVSTGIYGVEVKHRWEEAFSDMTAEEVIALIREFKGNAVPVNDYGRLLDHPQVDELGIVIDVPFGDGTMRGIGMPFAFSGTPPAAGHGAPPRLGEHTAEILTSLGYSDSEIDAARRAGVIKG